MDRESEDPRELAGESEGYTFSRSRLRQLGACGEHRRALSFRPEWHRLHIHRNALSTVVLTEAEKIPLRLLEISSSETKLCHV